MPESIPSLPDGTGLRVAVLTAQWHGAITARLQAAAPFGEGLPSQIEMGTTIGRQTNGRVIGY